LPLEYFHVVFTLPQQIAAYQNKEVVYGLLFEAVGETLKTIARDPDLPRDFAAPIRAIAEACAGCRPSTGDGGPLSAACKICYEIHLAWSGESPPPGTMQWAWG
jgi:hypothetical protein